jgi:amino acid transporter
MPVHKKPVAGEPVTSVLQDGVVLSFDCERYKPEFKREFPPWTSFCVSFAVLGLLPSFAGTLYFGMGYAGTPGMVWAWLIAVAFIQCVAMGMAELCSSMPASGGLYYASAALAPPGWGPLAAWITGWSNWLGQVAAAPSTDYARMGNLDQLSPGWG